MPSRVLQLYCRAEGVEQFRTSRPPPVPRGSPVQGRNWWKRVPSNCVTKRPATEEEIRKALHTPRRDPFARLEFLKPDDLSPPLRDPPEATAMPVEDRNLIKASEVREEILRRLDRVQTAQFKKLTEEGKVTQEELEEMKHDLERVQEDPSMLDKIDQVLHPEGEDEAYAEYPEERDGAPVDRSAMSFLDQLTFDYHIPGYVEFEKLHVDSDVSIPVVRLSHCNGEEVVISLHGGCVLSWTGREGRERLFQNAADVFDGRQPIRSSGVSLAFPQYGKSGAIPEDGFVNRLLWDVVRSEVGVDWLPDPAPSVTLFCRDNEQTRKIWPHNFEIYYKITLGETDEFGPLEAPIKEQRHFVKRAYEIGSLKGMKEELEAQQKEAEEAHEKKKQRRERKRRGSSEYSSAEYDEEDLLDEQLPEDPIPTQLRLQLTVRNTGDKPMAFMLACRTHFTNRGMRDFGDFVRILGLGGRYYIDYNIVPGKPILRAWNEDYLILDKREEGWNAIFTENVPNDVFFCDGYPEYYETITRQGFPDIMLMQPSPLDAGSDYVSNNMTMLGRGRVTVPARLEPGEKWEGEYILRHHNRYFKEPIFGYEGSVPPPDVGEIEVPIQDPSLITTDRRS